MLTSGEILVLYSLLSSQVPPGKISLNIRNVVLAFFPDIDPSSLKLPGKSCAGYMRREELTTISTAHHATALLEHVADEDFGLYLNSDGTTKSQHNLNTLAFNSIVLSVSKVPDSKANAILCDIELQLQKLRKATQELGIPNHAMLNWSLFCAFHLRLCFNPKAFERSFATMQRSGY